MTTWCNSYLFVTFNSAPHKSWREHKSWFIYLSIYLLIYLFLLLTFWHLFIIKMKCIFLCLGLTLASWMKANLQSIISGQADWFRLFFFTLFLQNSPWTHLQKTEAFINIRTFFFLHYSLQCKGWKVPPRFPIKYVNVSVWRLRKSSVVVKTSTQSR